MFLSFCICEQPEAGISDFIIEILSLQLTWKHEEPNEFAFAYWYHVLTTTVILGIC